MANNKPVAGHPFADELIESPITEARSILASQYEALIACVQPDRFSFALTIGAERRSYDVAGDPFDSLRAILAAAHYFST
jgi:hypothetical protein